MKRTTRTFGLGIMKRIAIVLMTGAIVALGAQASLAASHHKADPSCSVSPNPAAVNTWYAVSASGLPIGTAINLWITDPSGNTTRSPLGSTGDGTFSMNESSGWAGTWTYTFSAPTKNNPNVTVVYASCSVGAAY